ncbi:MAG: hypothetical protein OEV14_06580 [Gammaproteobacteria bacterium]|jgi:uncharacterized membrane protein|nr:hypothetical protein [Gammaproteobacteria bacterium]
MSAKSILSARSVILLAGALLAMPFADAVAGKTPGGTAIRVEDLGKPAGSVRSAAGAINDAGNAVVGWAYFDATFEYRNNNYAARWTRSSGSGAWQAEDLRPLLPMHKTSYGTLVNNAGTVVISTEYLDSTYHGFVITSAGQTLELGRGEYVNDLDELDHMIGSRRDPSQALPELPLFWASPSGPAAELPVIQSGFGGQARWFQGVDIVGTLADDSGKWLVRWSKVSDQWIVTRLLKLPSYDLTGVGPGGRLAFMHCTGPLYNGQTVIGCDWRAAVWDPPYDGAPTYLPNLAGTYSWTGGVMDDGTIPGLTVASNGVDMLPVLWPTPTTLVRLPLLSGGKSGGTSGFNAYRQIAGYVDVPVKGRSTYHAVVWTLP